jgi:hypothetical protein
VSFRTALEASGSLCHPEIKNTIKANKAILFFLSSTIEIQSRRNKKRRGF